MEVSDTEDKVLLKSTIDNYKKPNRTHTTDRKRTSRGKILKINMYVNYSVQ